MHLSHGLADGYVRRLYLASARRTLRSLTKALVFFLVAAGLVCLGVVGLGMIA